MKTKFYFIGLLFLLLPSLLIGQRYRELAEQKIKKDEALIEQLEKTNNNLKNDIKRLRGEIQYLRKQNSSKVEKKLTDTEKQLEGTINKVFQNNLLLQQKENEIRILKNNIAALQFENEDLKRKLTKLETNLTTINAANLKQEQELVEELKMEGNYRLAINAKNQAIQTVMYQHSGAIYFTLEYIIGEQFIPHTRFIAFCKDIKTNYINVNIQYPNSAWQISLVLNGHGSFKVFTHKKIKYKLTILKSYRNAKANNRYQAKLKLEVLK